MLELSSSPKLAEVSFLYPGDLVSCKKADVDFLSIKKLDTFPCWSNLVGGQMAKHSLSSYSGNLVSCKKVDVDF